MAANDTLSSQMHGTHLTFGEPFLEKHYDVLVIFSCFFESIGVLIELSEESHRKVTVSILNGET